MPRVALNGVELYYEDSGSGASVVWVHGGFASLDTVLRHLAPYDWSWEWDFARQFHFIWYDRRGCYRSSSPGEGYELENQARDLELLLDHLEVDCAHVIGSSAGGPISIVFAATRPDRVRSLVLQGTGLDLFPEGDRATEILRQQIQIFEREGAEVAFDRRPEGVEVSFGVLWEREEMEVRGTLDEYVERQAEFQKQAQCLPRSQRIRHYAAELRNIKAYMDADVYAYAQQINAPTLVLHGANDRVVPLAWGEALARAIPCARLRVIHDASHGPIFRNDAARGEAIQFIQDVEGRRTTASI
ncbi:MAG TPA: alpha/beta hydrolase [Ardenticatenaceae bacterium]|nr:alpha/beta hydrolase [Ardenticatenaceae bacterium]